MKTVVIQKLIDCNELTCGNCKGVFVNSRLIIGKCEKFKKDKNENNTRN